MSVLKQIDDLIQSAGLENLGSFLHNLVMMFDQELAAIKAAAEENAAVDHRCPTCGERIKYTENARFFLQTPQDKPEYFVVQFECASCVEILSAHVVVVDVHKLPF